MTCCKPKRKEELVLLLYKGINVNCLFHVLFQIYFITHIPIKMNMTFLFIMPITLLKNAQASNYHLIYLYIWSLIYLVILLNALLINHPILNNTYDKARLTLTL